MTAQKRSLYGSATVAVFLAIIMVLPLWGENISLSSAAEPCECDLNNDGSCDGLDWLLFYPDWGRTDCPRVYPASVAMDKTEVPYHTFSNILINGVQFNGPVAPGDDVEVSFDWVRERIPECPYCIHQHYVGFAGEPATCVQSGQAPASGSADVVLRAPATAGRHIIAGFMTLEYSCQSIIIPVNPDFDSFTAIIRVEEP